MLPLERRHRLPHRTGIALYHQTKGKMSALYILIIASIAVAAFFLAAFIWSVRSSQFDDQQGASMRMLYDNDKTKN